MQTYHLIALLGVTPQVITEAVWALAQRGLRPASVYLLTTIRGEAHAKAWLFGKRVKDPNPRMPEKPYIANLGRRWMHLSEILGFPLPQPRILVPQASTSEPFDIRNKADDEQFAQLCYRTVHEVIHQADDAVPVYASLAGGRKTMSAHLMAAMSVYARPIDHLIHVLLQPADYENNHAFFYPTPATADAHIEVVYVPFPHLNALIKERYGNTIGDAGQIRWLLHQNGIMPQPAGKLQSLHVYIKPKSITVQGRNAEDTPLFTQELPPRLGMTALLLWDETLTQPERQVDISEVFLTQLPKRFKILSETFRMKERAKSWDAQDVSREVSELNAHWAKEPDIKSLLQIKRLKSASTLIYQWQSELPASIYIYAQTSARWPFRHLIQASHEYKSRFSPINLP